MWSITAQQIFFFFFCFWDKSQPKKKQVFLLKVLVVQRLLRQQTYLRSSKKKNVWNLFLFYLHKQPNGPYLTVFPRLFPSFWDETAEQRGRRQTFVSGCLFAYQWATLAAHHIAGSPGSCRTHTHKSGVWMKATFSAPALFTRATMSFKAEQLVPLTLCWKANRLRPLCGFFVHVEKQNRVQQRTASSCVSVTGCHWGGWTLGGGV